MSRFFKALRGAPKSSTIQGNGLIATIFAILQASELGQDPNVAAVFTVITLAFNFFNRFRTKDALEDKVASE